MACIGKLLEGAASLVGEKLVHSGGVRFRRQHGREAIWDIQHSVAEHTNLSKAATSPSFLGTSVAIRSSYSILARRA